MKLFAESLVVGVVSDLEDPERLARVRVKFPHLEDKPSAWARLVAPMAGPDRGVFLRPEVGDEVLVGFEQGEPRRPFILGALWSTVDAPPSDDGKAKENNWRFVKSRSGHILKFDDTRGKERIEIIDKDGQRQVILDSAKKKIQVLCQQGDVEVKAAAGSVTIEAVEIEVKAKANLKLEAGGVLSVKGATVNIN